MSHPADGLRVPVLMVPFEEATITNGVLRLAGPAGVTFPPRLPFESKRQVAVAIENPNPVAGSTSVRISIAGPDGVVLPESVRDHTVRWRPSNPPGGPSSTTSSTTCPSRSLRRVPTPSGCTSELIRSRGR